MTRVDEQSLSDCSLPSSRSWKLRPLLRHWIFKTRLDTGTSNHFPPDRICNPMGDPGDWETRGIYQTPFFLAPHCLEKRELENSCFSTLIGAGKLPQRLMFTGSRRYKILNYTYNIHMSYTYIHSVLRGYMFIEYENYPSASFSSPLYSVSSLYTDSRWYP